MVTLRRPAEGRSLQSVTFESLQSARAGDGLARNRLFERLRPRLVLWSQSRMSPGLRARHDPEDVAQEILLSLHRSIDSFQGEDPRAFRAWVFTVAEHRIRDLVDRAGALKRRTPEPREARGTSPSEAASRAEIGDRVRDAIGHLRDDYRDVIRLRRLEERDTADVARVLDRTPNAVRILYCRALAALREELGGFD